MINTQSCQQTIRAWIRERKGRELHLAEDAPLAGVLDSVDFLELLLMIEETYAVRVNPFDLSPQELGSVARIVSYIAARTPH